MNLWNRRTGCLQKWNSAEEFGREKLLQGIASLQQPQHLRRCGRARNEWQAHLLSRLEQAAGGTAVSRSSITTTGTILAPSIRLLASKLFSTEDCRAAFGTADVFPELGKQLTAHANMTANVIIAPH